MLLNGRDRSPFTRRIAISMQLLGLPFERQRITAWDNLDEVRQYNPLGRVPSLVLDDGEILCDSAAILDYIDELVGPELALIPPTGLPRREVLKYVSCAFGVVEKAVHSRYEVVMRPAEKIHQPWLDHNKEQIQSGLQWLDAAVARTWVFDFERITQALVSTVVAWDFLPFAGSDLAPAGQFPRLEALRANAYDIPAFAETDPSRE
jgi:glutathione S-transferase